MVSLNDLYTLARNPFLRAEGHTDWSLELANAIVDKFESRMRETTPDYVYPLDREQVALEILWHFAADKLPDELDLTEHTAVTDILPGESNFFQGIMDAAYALQKITPKLPKPPR